MSKYQRGDFLQIPRDGFRSGAYSGLSVGALAMLLWLKELEHRFTYSDDNKYFYQSDDNLADLMNVSERSIRRWRQELINAGLIEFDRLHFKDTKSGKLSAKRIACYKFNDSG